MQGHAGANMTPLIASNRIGTEILPKDSTSAIVPNSSIKFYGTSFIADETGAIVVDADDASETTLVASFDLDKIAAARASWGMFRDRRPDLYRVLLTKDGSLVAPGLW